METATNSNFSSFSNTSVQDDCVEIRFSAMEYLPWDNPDNVISLETEGYARQFKNSSLVFLFLIGGPGNVINMVVFYKQSLRDRVNLCLFFLSLADEIYLTTAMFMYGEDFYLQFTTGETFGPMLTFMANNKLNGFLGFVFASYALSAIIACERCVCIMSPLKYATFMRTRTMLVIILFVLAVIVGLFFIVVFRYTAGCVRDLDSGMTMTTTVVGEFYSQHKDLVDVLDSFFFGFGIQGGTVLVVTTATILTTFKLRQIVAWRAETTSGLSSREIGLTKMLIGSSVFFILCVGPPFLFRLVSLFFPEMNAERRNQNLYFLCIWVGEAVAYVNSSFNIVIYYAMGSRFRETFWTLFRRRVSVKTET